MLQFLLCLAVIGNGDRGRCEMKAGEKYKGSTDTEVDRGEWRIANEGDVGEDRM